MSGDVKPTCDLQLISADLTLEVNTPPPFSVIGSTKAGHIHDTLLVDVHITGCRDRGREGSKDMRKIWMEVR